MAGGKFLFAPRKATRLAAEPRCYDKARVFYLYRAKDRTCTRFT